MKLQVLGPRWLLAFMALVVVAGAAGFIFKMSGFAETIFRHQIFGFGIVAIGSYAIGLVALLMLTLWAISSGQFRDLEAPKHRMLELEKRWDAIEERQHRPVLLSDLEENAPRSAS